MPNPSESYQNLASREFNTEAQQLYHLLLAEIGKPESIIPGPVYYAETSQGMPLMVNSYNSGISESHHSQKYGQLFLLATDKEGQLVGTRHTEFSTNSEFLFATGLILIKERGIGLSIPLELAHFSALQQEANRRHKELRYQVHNQNLVDLEELDTSVSADAVSQKETEQQRWQALYGPEGKLGFDQTGKKIFLPQNVPQSSLDLRITSHTTSVNGRNLVNGTYTPVEEAKQLSTKEKYQRLLSKLLPQLTYD